MFSNKAVLVLLVAITRISPWFLSGDTSGLASAKPQYRAYGQYAFPNMQPGYIPAAPHPYLQPIPPYRYPSYSNDDSYEENLQQSPLLNFGEKVFKKFIHVGQKFSDMVFKQPHYGPRSSNRYPFTAHYSYTQ